MGLPKGRQGFLLEAGKGLGKGKAGFVLRAGLGLTKGKQGFATARAWNRANRRAVNAKTR